MKELHTFLSFPTISAEGKALEETSDFVLEKLKSIGFRVGKLRLNGAPPLVIAERRGESKFTLVFYNHYDVQPTDPLDEWKSDPFGGEIRDNKIFARGVADDKGDLFARINAIESLLGVGGELPVSVKFVIEGEEEIGSPHLHDYVDKYGPRMKGDLCLWEGSDLTLEGTPQFYLGVKGVLYVELKVATAKRDQHSMYAPIVPNPAWKLVWLLNNLKDTDEKIKIPRFYNDVLSPSKEELAVVQKNNFTRDTVKKALAVHDLLPAKTDLDTIKNLLFNPTCNIAGFTSGYGGPGIKTVLPREAKLKMDFRLVPDQDPNKILRLLKQYLHSLGYGDIGLDVHASEKPAKTSLNTPHLKALVRAAREVYAADPIIWPTMFGTGPMALFINDLRLPSIMPPSVSYAGSGYHGPNEHVFVSHYMKAIRYFAESIIRLGQQNQSY